MLPAMKIPTTLAQSCALKRLSTTITDGTIKKPLSISASHSKRFVINDHYEFDQKVSHFSFIRLLPHLINDKEDKVHHLTKV